VLSIPTVSFYYNFALIFKGLEDIATKGIEIQPLLTTPLSMTPHRARTLANISVNLILLETRVTDEHFWTFMSLTVSEYFHSFSHSCLRKRGRKI